MSNLSGYSVEASNDTLLRQAPMTAESYMIEAIKCIDEQFGKGYAKAHSELVGAFMSAAAADLGAAVITRAVQTIGEAIDRLVDELGQDWHRHDHPLMGETFKNLASAIDGIAVAINNHND